MLRTRFAPNILVTGTPGCGKTSTCELLQRRLKDANYYNISDFAQQHECYDGYDEARKSHIVDEDRLLDELEPLMRKGGAIVDWHVNDIFPERLIDLVVVLRTDNTVLYDRLKSRGYHEAKIQENIDAEIMGVVIQDAQDSYEKEIVVELQSDTADQMDENVDRIASWSAAWLEQNPKGVTNELVERGSDEEDGTDEEGGSYGNSASSGEDGEDA